jgi:hypothetical protein
MAVNLSRNTKVFFTTYNADGLIPPASEVLANYTNTNTFEIQVLDGYSFTQNTEQQTITLSEAGTAPVRGERSFNSKLNPVDWSLSTYIRPYKVATTVTAPEKYLWNALFGFDAIDNTGTTITAAAKVTATTITINTAATLFGGATLLEEQSKAIGSSVAIRGVTVNTLYNGEYQVTNVTGTGPYVYTLDTDGVDVGAGAPTLTSAKVYKGQWFESAGNNAIASTLGSNKNTLQSIALLFKVDNTFYKVYNCAVNQGEISFDLQGIAMIAWTGFGTTLADITTPLVGWAGSNYLAAPSTADNYITNKLSTTTLISNISGAAGTTYSLPITGGNITINNNIEYVTPENMGVVNNSIGYFTGTRSITGSLNAYLKTGTNESGDLLKNIVAGLATTSETKFKLQVEIGGILNATKVEMLMNGCQLQVPTVDVQDVVSTTINFTAQGYTGVDYDIGKTNNLKVTYYGVV